MISSSSSSPVQPDPALLQQLLAFTSTLPQPQQQHSFNSGGSADGDISISISIPLDASSSESASSSSSSSSAAAVSAASASPPLPDVNPLLPILLSIATTGRLNGYPWPAVRQLLSVQLQRVMQGYAARSAAPLAASESAADPEGFSHLLLLLANFPHAPFTLQRLCELVTTASSLYTSASSFLLAVGKCVYGISADEQDGDAEDGDIDDGAALDDDEEQQEAARDGDAEQRLEHRRISHALDYMSKELPIQTVAVTAAAAAAAAHAANNAEGAVQMETGD